jgi:hypothetical protein
MLARRGTSGSAYSSAGAANDALQPQALLPRRRFMSMDRAMKTRFAFRSEGETLAGNLFLPERRKPVGVVVAVGPLTSVKEQARHLRSGYGRARVRGAAPSHGDPGVSDAGGETPADRPSRHCRSRRADLSDTRIPGDASLCRTTALFRCERLADPRHYRSGCCPWRSPRHARGWAPARRREAGARRAS